ncbi:MAG: polysaccharide pyruvyl transferase family protein [Coprococcus sp.]
MRVLVLGVYYDGNLGDAVICDCVAARIKYHFKEAQVDVCDLLDRHEFIKQQETPMDLILKRRRRKKLRERATVYFHWDKQLRNEQHKLENNKKYIEGICAQSYDIVVFAGGQVFMDAFALFLDAYIQHFSKKKTPVIFNACGTGPAFSKNIRKCLSDALLNPCVKLISTRDDVKLIEKYYLHGKKTAVETYDPALWVSDVYGVVKNCDSDTVGLGMMFVYNKNIKDVTRFWTGVIRLLEKRKVRWKIFVNGDMGDVTFAKHVLDNIPELTRPKEEYFAPVPEKPEELVQVIASFKSLISFRLHSHIIASVLDIPTVAMVWDNKLRFYFEKIGHGERCMTVDSDPEEVLMRLERAEAEGYDRRIIEEQKQYADNLLYQAICESVEKAGA